LNCRRIRLKGLNMSIKFADVSSPTPTSVPTPWEPQRNAVPLRESSFSFSVDGENTPRDDDQFAELSRLINAVDQAASR
jgi:hypothetical protein